MNEVSAGRFWMYRGCYLAIGFVLVIWSIIPFDLSAGALPRPDIFYCITMVYIIRKPEWVPVWSVFIVFFLRDILTNAPLGLFTILVVLGTEVVRGNIQAFREYIFTLEWIWIGAIFAIITVVQQIILVLMLAQSPRFLDQIILIVFTVAAYPVIVGVMKYGFGFTRPRPGELDAWGRRL